MATSKWLERGKTTGTLKWNGNIEDLKKFCQETFKIELNWTRGDGRFTVKR